MNSRDSGWLMACIDRAIWIILVHFCDLLLLLPDRPHGCYAIKVRYLEWNVAFVKRYRDWALGTDSNGA